MHLRALLAVGFLLAAPALAGQARFDVVGRVDATAPYYEGPALLGCVVYVNTGDALLGLIVRAADAHVGCQRLFPRRYRVRAAGRINSDLTLDVDGWVWL